MVQSALNIAGAAILVCLSTGCGGSVESGSGADADAGGVDDGARDSGPSSDTQCTSSEGFAVCHGPHQCPNRGQECDFCFGDPFDRDATVPPRPEANICVNDAWIREPHRLCGLSCRDGEACLTMMPHAGLTCALFGAAKLLARNAPAERVTYADFSPWTGEELPEVPGCDATSSLQLCGGACGPCPAGSVCTGRSPTHPRSFCVPSNHGACSRAKPACSPGEGCFIFSVAPASQSIADANGKCLARSLCESAASGLPGGGTCVVL
jgi:hypothetical protein